MNTENRKSVKKVVVREVLERMYVQERMTMLAMSKVLGVSNVTLKKRLLEAGIEIRSHSETQSENSGSKGIMKYDDAGYAARLGEIVPHIRAIGTYGGTRVPIEHYCDAHKTSFTVAPMSFTGTRPLRGCPTCTVQSRHANTKYDERAKKIAKTVHYRYGMSTAKFFAEKTARSRILTSVSHLSDDRRGEYFDRDWWVDNYVDSVNGTRWLMDYFGVKIDVIRGQMKRLGIDVKETYISRGEREIADYIQSLGYDIVTCDRTIIGPRELDIVIPSKGIAFEYNGVYWHSDDKIESTYHADKLAATNDVGLDLVQIWEDDWEYEQERVKLFISNKLGANVKKRDARKCVVSSIEADVYKAFLETNHMRGSDSARLRFGLFYGEELIAVMGFRDKPSNVGVYGDGVGFELSRFASVGVRGGFSKLLAFFVRQYEPDFVYSFLDLELSSASDNVYLKCGFVESHRIKPDYTYLAAGRRRHKFGFRKAWFEKNGYDVTGKTEAMLAAEAGIPRCWDSGKIAYVLRR